MANSSEPSSSLSFSSCSHMSNGSTNHIVSSTSGSEGGSSLEVISLNKLSSNLGQLLVDSGSSFSDADIIVEGSPVGVHRCILAARSKFFYELFQQQTMVTETGGKPKYFMTDLIPYGKVGCEAFLIFLSYLYTGKLKPFPTEVSTCVDPACPHDACGPAISFAVELMYASSIFQIPELVSVFQRRLLSFVEKAFVEDVIQILAVAFHCQLSQLVTQCVDRVTRSDFDSISVKKELPHEVAENIRLLRLKLQSDDEQSPDAADPVRDKGIRRILKALDSDDVELVKLLLHESNMDLDQANALHYAAAYCDHKIVSELLNLNLADVNCRNRRGYTVLHIAAMRKEPAVIVSLLSKGACASALTSDGRSAVSICCRLTRMKDYCAKTERGQEANKERLCIDVLEREMHRNPMAGYTSVSLQVADDLHMRLLQLENRVAFARLLFPTQARLAMGIANAEMTSEFAGLSGSKGPRREMDLNETPVVQNKRLLSRMEALMKTVENGRRYFPNCSEVLDKLEDDLQDLFYLETGTPDEQSLKKKRYMEVKDDFQKAFNKDKVEFDRSGISSSASSSPLKNGVSSRLRK